MIQNGNFTLLLTSHGQQWQFYIATDISWSRMAISHCYWHLVVRMVISHCYWHLMVNNGNFTLLLTSHRQQWQFHIATNISWSRMAISHCYRHLVVRMVISHCYWHLVARMTISHCYWHVLVGNGNFTLLLTASGQEWQFHIVTDS